MPIHDWTRVRAGIYHDFHCTWIPEIKRVLNGGILPDGYYAITEQQGPLVRVDLFTMHGVPDPVEINGAGSQHGIKGGVAVAEAPPRLDVQATGTEAAWYALKRRTITVRSASDDTIVAMIEILSPGNKDRLSSVMRFSEKCWSALAMGCHVVIVDLFPPNRHNPRGMHAEIWSGLSDEPYDPPADKLLTAAAYEAQVPVRAYAQPLAVGDSLPSVPLFLEPGIYVDLPLEASYEAAYANMPLRWRRSVEGRA